MTLDAELGGNYLKLGAPNQPARSGVATGRPMARKATLMGCCRNRSFSWRVDPLYVNQVPSPGLLFLYLSNF